MILYFAIPYNLVAINFGIPFQSFVSDFTNVLLASPIHFRISVCFSEVLSFVFAQCPRRYKKKKSPNQPIQKSNKPRYTSLNYDNEIPWGLDPNDR